MVHARAGKSKKLLRMTHMCIVLAWSVQVVKTSLFNLLFMVKIRFFEQHTWTMLTRWEVASVQALRDHMDVILSNSVV